MIQYEVILISMDLNPMVGPYKKGEIQTKGKEKSNQSCKGRQKQRLEQGYETRECQGLARNHQKRSSWREAWMVSPEFPERYNLADALISDLDPCIVREIRFCCFKTPSLC